MLIPPVSRYMTPTPIVVAPEDKLSAIRTVMREHRLRHLPVVESGKLVGILSDRDLHMVHVYGDRVVDVMTRDVATVSRDTPVDEAASLMETRRFSSVVILGDKGVEGIFTSTDALRALRDVIQRADASER